MSTISASGKTDKVVFDPNLGFTYKGEIWIFQNKVVVFVNRSPQGILEREDAVIHLAV
jgi:hypothetical protein